MRYSLASHTIDEELDIISHSCLVDKIGKPVVPGGFSIFGRVGFFFELACIYE